MIKFAIERTELITLKKKSQLEDLSCSTVAKDYQQSGFLISFSKAYETVIANPEGT